MQISIMTFLLKLSAVLVLASSVQGAGGPVNRRIGKDNELDISLLEAEVGEDFGDREARTLANVFPFVAGDRDRGVRPFPSARTPPAGGVPIPIDDRTAEASSAATAESAADSREARQRKQPAAAPASGSPASTGASAGKPDDLDIGSIAAAGERCIDKVVMVEETEYDEHIECHHSYSEKCHTTYTTDYEPQQEEECEENFKKSCFIEYKKVANEEPVRFCHTPLVCEGEGPEECKTVYESECETRYHEHDVEDDVVDCKTVNEEKCEDVTQGYTTEKKCTKWPKQECTTKRENVKKYSPETDCKKVPRQLCGPSGCVAQPGPEECFDKKETVVQEVPEETCNLEPQRACKHVTKLVPQLKPAEECVDIPKEVCSRSRKNPRKVQKPVIKKWCYIPTKESGLLA